MIENIEVTNRSRERGKYLKIFLNLSLFSFRTVFSYEGREINEVDSTYQIRATVNNGVKVIKRNNDLFDSFIYSIQHGHYVRPPSISHETNRINR